LSAQARLALAVLRLSSIPVAATAFLVGAPF
jgi:hypothetical protein